MTYIRFRHLASRSPFIARAFWPLQAYKLISRLSISHYFDIYATATMLSLFADYLTRAAARFIAHDDARELTLSYIVKAGAPICWAAYMSQSARAIFYFSRFIWFPFSDFAISLTTRLWYFSGWLAMIFIALFDCMECSLRFILMIYRLSRVNFTCDIILNIRLRLHCPMILSGLPSLFRPA